MAKVTAHTGVVNVLLQRLDPGFHNVSLHHIKLKSNFVTRQVVMPEKPILTPCVSPFICKHR
jgi:hypothetical protein